MVYIFDGKGFSREKEKSLRFKAESLKKEGITPKLVSILIGNDSGSKLYLSLKKKAAERVGANVEIKKLSEKVKKEEVIELIKELNGKKDVHGVMIQLPFPKHFSWDERNEIINTISPKKDVDGMREVSPYVVPVVKAVLYALKESGKNSGKIAVVGAKGFVGKKIMKELRSKNYELRGYDVDTENLSGELLESDIIVSATGVPGLIRGSIVKEGVVVIDVGSPKADVQFNEVAEKASFITPVPGGVGPVTVSCLLENLTIAAKS